MVERVARETTPLPVESAENLNTYDIAQAQFDTAAQYVEIPDGLREYLRHMSRLTTVEFPIEEDDGKVNAHLRTRMEAATDAVLQTQIEIRDRHGVGVDLRTAAFVTAIKRVASVALARGIWP
jgi:glutamate dehydrogenase/leucine dehydrogenase